MKALAALGLAVLGAVFIWLSFFGIFFLVDDARHKAASLPHGGGLIALLVIFTVILMIASGILTEYWHRKGKT